MAIIGYNGSRLLPIRLSCWHVILAALNALLKPWLEYIDMIISQASERLFNAIKVFALRRNNFGSFEFGGKYPMAKLRWYCPLTSSFSMCKMQDARCKTNVFKIAYDFLVNSSYQYLLITLTPIIVSKKLMTIAVSRIHPKQLNWVIIISIK